MLVVSLRGVNFRFWSQGVLGKTLLYLAVRVKVFDDNVFAIIESRCIGYLSVF